MTTTWSPTDKAANITLSNGNLTATAAVANTTKNVRATTGKAAGKLYFELVVGGTATGFFSEVGFLSSAGSLTSAISTANPGFSVESSGGAHVNGVAQTGGPTYTTGNAIAFAVDFDNWKYWFRKNGVWQNTGWDPGTNTGGWTITTHTTYLPTALLYSSGCAMTANFGASAFTYSLPTGFAAWDVGGAHMAADAAAQATATANLDVQHHLAASFTATAAMSVSLSLEHHMSAAASALATAALSGIRISRHMAAAISAVAVATSILEVQKGVGADAHAIASGTGALDVRKHLAAAAQAVATATTDLHGGSSGLAELAAAAQSIADAHASLQVLKDLTAAAMAQASAVMELSQHTPLGAVMAAEAQLGAELRVAKFVEKVKPAVQNVEVPWQSIVNRADPSQAEANRRSLEYPFSRRKFYGDTARRGAYS